MRYLVDLTQKQLDVITKLINTGKYQTVAQFILTAVENQIYIENSEELSQYVGIGKMDPSVLRGADIPTNEFRKIGLITINSQPGIVPLPTFSNLSLSLYKAEEEKCWLWGQTNKIFPVKIGLRILYASIGSEQWMNLEEYRDIAANIVANIGTIIRKYEDKNDKLRDERISAGLPDVKKIKSKARYKGHFLAYMRKDGILDGAMPCLRFVNLKRNERGKVFIGLTEAGLIFAKLENPVIDQQNFERSFNEKEIDFYLTHIFKNVKGENSAIKWLLRKLIEGIIVREDINNELKKEFSQVWNASDAVINTQRSGLMARMYELGLIEKKKMGINVRYNITEKGKIFLKNNNLFSNYKEK